MLFKPFPKLVFFKPWSHLLGTIQVKKWIVCHEQLLPTNHSTLMGIKLVFKFSI